MQRAPNEFLAAHTGLCGANIFTFGLFLFTYST